MAPARGLNPWDRSAGGGPGSDDPRRRKPRWLRALLLLLILVPIVEILVIVAVGHAIGGGLTFLLLVLCSVLGAVLVKKEGSRVWAALRAALVSGRMPARELADGALVLVGGTLLLAPGFVTAVIGLFFILPVTRPITRRWLELIVGRRLLRTPGFPPGMGGPSSRGHRSTGSTSSTSNSPPPHPGRHAPGQGDSGTKGHRPPPDDDIIEGEIL